MTRVQVNVYHGTGYCCCRCAGTHQFDDENDLYVERHSQWISQSTLANEGVPMYEDLRASGHKASASRCDFSFHHVCILTSPLVVHSFVDVPILTTFQHFMNLHPAARYTSHTLLNFPHVNLLLWLSTSRSNRIQSSAQLPINTDVTLRSPPTSSSPTRTPQFLPSLASRLSPLASPITMTPPAFVTPALSKSFFVNSTLCPSMSSRRPSLRPLPAISTLKATQAVTQTEYTGGNKKLASADNAAVKTKKKKKFSSALGKVLVMGLSHHTATVDVRERLAVPEAQWQEAAMHLCQLSAVSEAAVLSTCNRFEVYVVTDHPFKAIQEVVAHLSSRSGLSVVELRRHLFMLVDDEACWHLLRVSAGLDSLVIGEGQILAQVKKCYELAGEKDGFAGKILSRLLNVAVSAGKRVRSETGIAKGAVSISSAAVELAEMKALPDLKMALQHARVCILGAGKMSRLLVQHLLARGVDDITIVNRSVGRAEELAKMFPDAKLNIRLMDAMLQSVATSDVVFTSTAASEPILTKNILEPVVAGMNGLVLIDISVPRNVSDDVKELDGVFSYNVDDLKAVVAKNQARRRRLTLEAEELLREELGTFNNWHNSLGCVPAISKLQQRAESIRQDEMERVKSKLAGLSASELNAVEQLSKGIINKMLHSPMVHLRGLADMEERTQTLKNIEALFKL